MKILVGSKNPVKIKAVEEAFKCYFNDVKVLGIEVQSNVPEQPVGNEIFIGAENRAQHLVELNWKENLNADFFVGIEGGINQTYGRWFAFGCICIIDKKLFKAFGTSPHFELPNLMIEKLLSGIELGTIIDEHTNMHNTKQNSGAIGYFTKGKIDRENLYLQGLLVSLVPFINYDLFFDRNT
jgi:inosine/xanthosine triphosphatase